MKRCRVGAWLLAALLVIGLLSSWAMVKCCEPVGNAAAEAAAAALREDWDNAEALVGQARAQWKKYWGFCAAFADHEPMEDINGLFAQLEVYAQSRDPQNFAAVCAQLSEDTKAIGEAHSLKWWNLL